MNNKSSLKLILGVFILLFFVCLSFNQSAQANDAITYKSKITDIMNNDENDGDGEYYHIKLNKTASNLLINIKLPDRKRIYGSDFYWYEAVHAAKNAQLKNTNTVTIKDDDDKYTFNLYDIQALDLTTNFIKQWGLQNNPSDYDDCKDQGDYDKLRQDYVSDTLKPKAINHISYSDDEDD